LTVGAGGADARSGGTDAPRVLAFADFAGSYVAAWRVHGPLAALQRSGRIADYVVTDARLGGIPRASSFDVIWLQRGVDPQLVQLVADRFGGRFLLDIDDHLLCRPEYLGEHEFPPAQPVVDALRACSVLATTSQRLCRLLEDRSGLALAGKLVVCPNATGLSSVSPREPRPPEAVLLTQGQRLALVDSADEVLAAIGDFCARRALPLCYFGPRPARLSPLAERRLRNVVEAGEIPLTAYHAALDRLPAMLAVAPLETSGDPRTVEFVAGKSDVKMVEYGGFGHCGVYSDAPPYADSDLRCGRLARNTYDAWTAALDEALAGGWRLSAAQQADTARRRDIARVAEDCWAPALERARLQRPRQGGEIIRTLDRWRARVSGAKARLVWNLSTRWERAIPSGSPML